jgi:hypothetical protein
MEQSRKGCNIVICVVMQPAFFPWAGYFNLASRADVFVFLDDVQLEKQSWQTRNRILLEGKPAWINVPVLHESLNQVIRDSEVCDQFPWRHKLLRMLTQGYARHPHRDAMLEVASLLPQIAPARLADINIGLILACCQRLGLAPRFARSGELSIAGERSERLIRICEHFGCDEYLSPVGASDYLAEDRFSERGIIRLSLQQYAPAKYKQPKSAEFISHLSIIDVVANLGWKNASQYVRGEAVGV